MQKLQFEVFIKEIMLRWFEAIPHKLHLTKCYCFKMYNKMQILQFEVFINDTETTDFKTIRH